MSADPHIKARFEAFRAVTQPTLAGSGGPAARATVQRHRRRNLATGLIAVVLVVVGAIVTFAGLRPDENRLIPANPPPSATPFPTMTPADYRQIGDTTVDLSKIGVGQCGGVKVPFKHLGRVVDGTFYQLGLWTSLPWDLNDDGAPDGLLLISCTSQDGAKATWPILVTGDTPHLIAWKALPLPYAANGVSAASPTATGTFVVEYGSGTCNATVTLYLASGRTSYVCK